MGSVTDVPALTSDGRHIRAAVLINKYKVFGETVYAVNISDISERNNLLLRLENELKLSKRVLALMSHYLKTPLTPILGFSEMLSLMADKISADKIREYAAGIQQGGKEAEYLINRLLKLSELYSDSYEPNISKVETEKLFGKVLDTVPNMKQIFVRPNTQVGINVGKNSDYVMFDIDVAETIVGSLVSNAIKHTPDGTHITIRSKGNSQEIIYEIEDNGPGFVIPDGETIDCLFKPFNQHTDPTNSTSGPGLGLHLAKLSADRCGCKLIPNSSPGRTVIGIYIPREVGARAVQYNLFD